MIRILLAQRQTLLRGALATVLRHADDLEVIGESSSKHETMTIASHTRPDVVVLDQFVAGADEVAHLCDTVEGLRVLVLADRAECPRLVEVARLAPRVGLIATDSTVSSFVDAVRNLAAGEPVLDAKVTVAVLTARKNPFTERELSVLRLACQGLPVRAIAADLYLSVGTVRNYLARIVSKLGARSRIEAVQQAKEAGWI